jgi:hypothetical protein
VVACLGAVFLLYAAYLGQSRSLGIDADGASNVLQAWDMLHGNPLLRGWWLSDVSFYTTELPEYMLVELARGLNPGVIHAAAAATYTALLALAVLLAKGRATGTAGLLRVLIAGGIMLAPGPGVLSSPNHTGTQVPLLLIWLVIDRLDDAGTCPVWSACCSRVSATGIVADRRGPADGGGGLGRAGEGRPAPHPPGGRLCRRTHPCGLHHVGSAAAQPVADGRVGTDNVRR